MQGKRTDMIFSWSIRPLSAASLSDMLSAALPRFHSPPPFRRAVFCLVGAPHLPSGEKAHFTGRHPVRMYEWMFGCIAHGAVGRHQPPHWGLNAPRPEEVSKRRMSRGILWPTPCTPSPLNLCHHVSSTLADVSPLCDRAAHTPPKKCNWST